MELTPDLLETQQFPERFRGYDPDSVDDFLERVAAGLNELQERLDHLADRLMEAEERTVRNDLDGDVEVIDGRLDAIESIREALETAPRFESNEVGQTRIGSMGDIGGPVAVGANKIEIDRIAQLITLARDTADDAIDDAIASTRDQIGDLLADVLVASSTDLAARGATDRKAELETELLELDARVNARRNDAHQLAELIETRRRALGEIARDLGGRPDGLEVDHPASSAEVGGWSTFDDSVNAEDDTSAHRRPATDARSGSEIDDPFFSALQRQQPLEGE
ncbi:MAG: DivIVA domain-containing protein [Acidimicrobiales bacterium]|jgi:DivIVA domain-containing protein|nr:DivIVA domain-containing protein [Acidimicrobiales bacterium]|tara:strand:- start:3286 stop:4128 length:843 start_codon:yes stop_codon:yes gene_type:complete